MSNHHAGSTRLRRFGPAEAGHYVQKKGPVPPEPEGEGGPAVEAIEDDRNPELP